MIGQAEIDNYLRFEQANVDLVKYMMSHQTGDKGFEDLEIEVTCEKPALHANLTYMNYDALMDCAEKMADNIFVFWVSEGNDFYTSDFPIAVEPHANDARHQYCGLLMYGGELMMSLSPSLSLSIYDKDYFSEDNLDCSFIEADDKEVRRHNMMRYFYAQRHVFSYKNDFSLIELIYKMKGEHIFIYETKLEGRSCERIGKVLMASKKEIRYGRINKSISTDRSNHSWGMATKGTVCQGEER